ncbi:MAG TPA: M1 family metallopeptidase [Vicinamibacterales bacterium]
MVRAAVLFVLALGASVPCFAQRLPGGVTPTHYDLMVEPDLAAATFAGTEKITVTLRKPATAIVLNAAEITFDKVSITAGGKTQEAKVSEDGAKEQVTFTVASAIPAGEATIAIAYRGILNDQLRGLYLSKANNRRYAVTQLEATDARRMFPSFDEPAFKATFSLAAVIDEGDHAISNGAVISDTPGPRPGQHTVKFDTSPKMSSYLVALAVGDFECIEGGADGTPIRVCSTPDKKALLGFALESAQQILKYYNRYYAVKYPFKKLDVVAVPDFAAGAMENVGAIFYRESYLLADPSNASTATKKTVAVVLAHEMAHQWFGDLVTMQWWDDIWLNEGFANWMESKPVEAWKPDWNIDLQDVQSNQQAMGLDALRSTRPIRSNASTPAEINELFDGIAYEKGAAVIRMIERWLGEEAFRKGVNAYIEKFKYGNARAEDFWSTVAHTADKPVDLVMKSFVDQPGVPIVNVKVNCTGGTGSVSVTQERYTREGAAPAAGNAVWSIPVCVKTPDGKTTCNVVSTKNATIPLSSCPAWVMPNAGARGYYRMGFSPEMLRALAPEVGKLEASERIALLDDEWALVRAGRHDVGSFLDLASGFKAERNADVLETLAGTIGLIDRAATNDQTRPAYRAWVAQLLMPALQDLGWTAKPGEPEDAGAARATVIGTLGRVAHDPQVLAKARELALQELENPGSLQPEMVNVAVDLAALSGDQALYDKFLARSHAATDPEEKYRYLYALTSFREPSLVRRTMELILSPEVRNQDAKIFLAQMLGSLDTQHLAWELLQARWDDIQKKTGEFVGNTVIVGGLSAFCDAKTAAEVRQFFSTHKVPDAERTLQQSLERIDSCVALSTAQTPKLAAWLPKGA